VGREIGRGLFLAESLPCVQGHRHQNDKRETRQSQKTVPGPVADTTWGKGRNLAEAGRNLRDSGLTRRKKKREGLARGPYERGTKKNGKEVIKADE